MTSPIYLDHNATTPVDERVIQKMLPYFNENYGNANSIDHLHGYNAKKAVQESRISISKILGCRKENEIIFTSGATESNNLALIGIYRKYRSKGNHIISSVIEHPSVLETLHFLESEGAEITLIPVDKYGVIDISELKKSIKKNTILISIMFANNEIGTIEPIGEIGRITKDLGIIFHTDAAQAVGHLKINVYEMNIDLLSFSAHKFYGPKGIGGLFIRSFSPYIKIMPIIFGGGHERGIRAGTLNVPGIIGINEALKIASKEMEETNKNNFLATERIYHEVKKIFPDIKRNGHNKKRLVHNLNLTIPGIENKALIHILKDKLSFSTGAACSTIKVEPSHVLKAIGLSDNDTFNTIRLGLSKKSSEKEIVNALIYGINHLK